MDAFTRVFTVRWGEMDFNAHMRNTAYLDMAADVRLMYFEEHGFPVSEFKRRQIGPVIRRDEIEYYREMHLMEQIRVSLQACGLSADAARFRLRNDFFNERGEIVARVTSSGGWLDHAARRLSVPPSELREAMRGISRTDDFEELSSLGPA